MAGRYSPVQSRLELQPTDFVFAHRAGLAHGQFLPHVRFAGPAPLSAILVSKLQNGAAKTLSSDFVFAQVTLSEPHRLGP